jgi:Spy/CpxP family protein refolding chaperone
MSTASLRLLPLALLLAVTAKAQTPASQTPTEQTREMSTRLQLNEGQFVRLLTLNRTRQTRQQEIEQATKSDLSARSSQLTELQTQYDQECSRILSPSQLSQLQQDESQTALSGGNG